MGVLALLAETVVAEMPLWEAGAGIGALDYPSWRGADTRVSYVAPLPYFVWRGKRFRADRNGARGILIDRDWFELDISADFALPVDSDENDARSGMDDLEPLVEVGPGPRFYLWHTSSADVVLQAPLRAAFSIDHDSVDRRGWTWTPRLAYRSTSVSRGPEYSISAGARFASRRYHAYFYDVPERQATPARPAYRAEAGYSGASLAFSMAYRQENLWAGLFTRYEYLGGTRYLDSPLVEQRHAVMVGLGVSLILARSKQTVPAGR